MCMFKDAMLRFGIRRFDKIYSAVFCRSRDFFNLKFSVHNTSKSKVEASVSVEQGVSASSLHCHAKSHTAHLVLFFIQTLIVLKTKGLSLWT